MVQVHLGPPSEPHYAEVVGIPETLEALRADARTGELAAFCADLGIDLLVLFGGARVDAARAGDIDLAYAFDRVAQGDDLAVVNALSERYPGDHLDLMPLDRADPVAALAALLEGEVLVERTPDAFAERQVLALGLFRDTQHLRDLALRAMAP